jgi:MoxR-like ATPase
MGASKGGAGDREANEVEARCSKFREQLLRIREALGRVVLGQGELIDQMLVGIFASGHVLIEGVPGLAKTLVVKALARTLGLTFRRVQFTPDLLPSDILGARTLVEGERDRKVIEFQPGPVFTHILLADEINRSGPKTQSALLEAMQERQVTCGGITYPIEEPFAVLATHNPIEQEGTYPLPEAQLDRFLLKLKVGLPSRADLLRILELDAAARLEELPVVMQRPEVLDARRLAREVPIAEDLKELIAELILASQPGSGSHPSSRVRLGLSPRAGQALVAAARVRALMLGRYHVAPGDLAAMLLPALRHRLVLTFPALAEGTQPEHLLEELARGVGLATPAR